MDEGELQSDGEVVPGEEGLLATPVSVENASGLVASLPTEHETAGQEDEQGTQPGLADSLEDITGSKAAWEEGTQPGLAVSLEDITGSKAAWEEGTQPSETGSCFGSCPSVHHPDNVAPPGPSLSLLASLKDLGEHGDHSLLPQALHQIAEAHFLERDYECAVQFIQLERLYHERLLSNLAALQEHCEHQIKAGVSREGTTVVSKHLDTLSHICRTHQRPCLGVPKQLTAGSKVLNSSLKPSNPMRGASDAADPLPAGTGVVEKPGQELLDVEMEDLHTVSAHTEKDTPTSVLHKAESCSTSPVPTQTTDTPSPVVTDRPAEVGGAPEVTLCTESDGFLEDLLTGSHTEHWKAKGHSDVGKHPSVDPVALNHISDAGQQTELSVQWCAHGHSGPLETRQETVRTGSDDSRWPPRQQMSLPEEQENWEEEEEEEEEEDDEEATDGEAVDDEQLSRTGLYSLDDLAKRIQVEETVPADGLVSILKRTAAPKQLSKRRVRFREPDDGIDQDEPSGASCLMLLLLCLITMVISVGGTALYCTFAGEWSSVCTDFSQNVDFYIGHMQHGLDQLRHWLSPSSQ